METGIPVESTIRRLRRFWNNVEVGQVVRFDPRDPKYRYFPLKYTEVGIVTSIAHGPNLIIDTKRNMLYGRHPTEVLPVRIEDEVIWRLENL